MADGENVPDGQEPEGTQGQEPNENTEPGESQGSETAGGQEPTGESGSTDPIVKDLRAENARRRREQRALEQRVAAFEKADQARKDAELTAEEKVAKRGQELDAREAALDSRTRETNLRAQVVALADELRIVDPQGATVLLREGYKIEYDAENSPTNTRELLDELLEAKPYLKAVAGSGSTGSSRVEGNQPGRQSVSGQSGETDEQRRSRLYGGGAGIWANPEQEGGGVVLTPDLTSA